jgi:hypothetical protein
MRTTVSLCLLLLFTSVVGAGDEPAGEDAKQSGPEAREYALEWRLAENETIKLRSVMTLEQELEQDKTVTNVKNTNTDEYTMTCEGYTEDGAAKISYIYTRIRRQVEYDGVSVDYDSDNPDPAELDKMPMLKGIAALPGMSISYELTRQWKIRNIKGLAELREKVLSSFKGGLKRAMEPSYSDKAITEQQEAAFRILPRLPVKAGAEWSIEFREAMGQIGFLLHDWTIKLKEVKTVGDHEVAELAWTGGLASEVSKNGDMPDAIMKLVDVGYSGNGSFDFAKGFLTSATTDLTVTINMDLEGDGEVDYVQKMVMHTSVEELPVPDDDATEDNSEQEED